MLDIALCDVDSGQFTFTTAYTLVFMQLDRYKAAVCQLPHPDDPLDPSSCVLNMDDVERFSKNRFIFSNGYSASIAAKRYSVVRDTNMNCLILKERS